jgi:hypothetical protein
MGESEENFDGVEDRPEVYRGRLNFLKEILEEVYTKFRSGGTINAELERRYQELTIKMSLDEGMLKVRETKTLDILDAKLTELGKEVQAFIHATRQ